MSTLEIILAILGVVFGSGNVAAFILFYKQNKKLKDIEVLSSKYQSDSQFLDNASKIINEWQDALDKCDCDRERLVHIIEDKNTEIKSLTERLLELQAEHNKINMEFQAVKWWKCDKIQCKDRRPPLAINGEQILNN